MYIQRLVASELSFPTSLTFDDEGTAYVAESGLDFGGNSKRKRTGGRILKILQDGSHKVLIDDLRPPVNGLVFHNESLYLSEGGHPGRLSRLNADGSITTILDNLPGPGNYHANMMVIGPDSKIYFSQGAMTNSGIIGLDSYELGWLRRLPHAHDIPGYDIMLSGVNAETINPLNKKEGTVRTGAFVPFGTTTKPNQSVSSNLPCTAAVMRCDMDGKNLELFAWGLRNAYGLGFMPDGRLLATDQSPDDRGSRPVGNAPDLLFEVKKGRWYGWPDFIGGEPITDPKFLPTRGPPLTFVLANHDELPPPELPLLKFPPHSASVKFDVAPSISRWKGHIFVALFGDERPMVAPPGPTAGRTMARIDPTDWTLHSLMVSDLSRPIDVRFNPLDGELYVLDFGHFEISPEHKIISSPTSGKLLRISDIK